MLTASTDTSRRNSYDDLLTRESAKQFAQQGRTSSAEGSFTVSLSAALEALSTELQRKERCAKLKNIASHFVVIMHPAGWRRICWDVLITLLVTLTVLIVPVQVAFDRELHFQHPQMVTSLRSIEGALDAVFLIDVRHTPCRAKHMRTRVQMDARCTS